MNDLTPSATLEIQATLQAMLYAQAQIIAKQEHGNTQQVFDQLMQFKEETFKKLAVPASLPQNKESD